MRPRSLRGLRGCEVASLAKAEPKGWVTGTPWGDPKTSHEKAVMEEHGPHSLRVDAATALPGTANQDRGSGPPWGQQAMLLEGAHVRLRRPPVVASGSLSHGAKMLCVEAAGLVTRTCTACSPVLASQLCWAHTQTCFQEVLVPGSRPVGTARPSSRCGPACPPRHCLTGPLRKQLEENRGLSPLRGFKVLM